MRIAQVSTIWEKTPPALYGGTERVVSNLTEGLVRRGHDVTLFATGDSKTSGRLEFVYPRALYRDGIPWTNPLYPLLHLTNAFDKAGKFDIIHMHFNTRQDYVALALADYVKTPTIFTIHFVLPAKNEKDRRDRFLLLEKYRRHNFVSISKAQRTLDFLHYSGTVYNGLDFSGFKFNSKPEDYVAWLGRFCYEKGTREAIMAAKKAKVKLVLAGKVDWANPVYKKYYEKEVKPKIDGKNVVYLGELSDREKIKFLRKAKAVLNPINWNEPFGLVTIEAMACGTPVIAFDRGPIREQIIDGRTGFIVRNVNEMAKAIRKVSQIDRGFCREQAISKFSAEAMTSGYEKLYEKILGKK